MGIGNGILERSWRVRYNTPKALYLVSRETVFV